MRHRALEQCQNSVNSPPHPYLPYPRLTSFTVAIGVFILAIPKLIGFGPIGPVAGLNHIERYRARLLTVTQGVWQRRGSLGLEMCRREACLQQYSPGL